MNNAIVRAILNYAAPIWFMQVSSTHLDKLEVIQNKDLRIATSCHQKASASQLRAETGVLPMRAHLELCSQQYYASALQPLHPSHLIVTSSSDSLSPRDTLQASYHHILRGMRTRRDDPNAPPLIFGGVLEEGAYPLARCLLRVQMIEEIVQYQAPNKVFMATPPPPSNRPSRTTEHVPSYRSDLSQLRSGYCSRIQSYHHSLGWADCHWTCSISSAALHIPRTWHPGI